MTIKQLNLHIGADYQFEYTNHDNITELRTARFIDAEFGLVDPYYPTPRLLFRMWAYDRNAERSFDPQNINFETWRQLTVNYEGFGDID